MAKKNEGATGTPLPGKKARGPRIQDVVLPAFEKLTKSAGTPGIRSELGTWCSFGVSSSGYSHYDNCKIWFTWV